MVKHIEKVEEVEEDIEVPFAVIENVPVFPGCEGQSGNNAKKQCMSDKIAEFVNKKFNTDDSKWMLDLLRKNEKFLPN